MKNLYEKTLNNYEKILLVCVAATFVAELSYGIVSVIVGNMTLGNFILGYFWKKCMVPSIIGIIVFFVSKSLLENPNIALINKPYVAIISFDVLCVVTTIVHTNYVGLWNAYILPIMIAAIFGRKQFSRVAMEIGLFGLLVSFTSKLIHDTPKEIDIKNAVVHLYISIVLLIVAYFVSMLIMHFVESNSALINEQLATQQNLTEAVKVDMMTGLLNHTAFYDELDNQIRISDRNGTPLCISVVDIDNFKSVNDSFGHANGDKVLITLSEILKEICKNHIVCRYGGEEFSVIFINCKKKEATALMEQVLERFRSTEFDWCSHPITFSCGVCQHYDIRVTAEDFFMQCDKYLYRAKKNGKNQVVSE